MEATAQRCRKIEKKYLILTKGYEAKAKQLQENLRKSLQRRAPCAFSSSSSSSYSPPRASFSSVASKAGGTLSVQTFLPLSAMFLISRFLSSTVRIPRTPTQTRLSICGALIRPFATALLRPLRASQTEAEGVRRAGRAFTKRLQTTDFLSPPSRDFDRLRKRLASWIFLLTGVAPLYTLFSFMLKKTVALLCRPPPCLGGCRCIRRSDAERSKLYVHLSLPAGDGTEKKLRRKVLLSAYRLQTSCLAAIS